MGSGHRRAGSRDGDQSRRGRWGRRVQRLAGCQRRVCETCERADHLHLQQRLDHACSRQRDRGAWCHSQRGGRLGPESPQCQACSAQNPRISLRPMTWLKGSQLCLRRRTALTALKRSRLETWRFRLRGFPFGSGRADVGSIPQRKPMAPNSDPRPCGPVCSPFDHGPSHLR